MDLRIDDLELRLNNWEEVLPKGEGHLDVDAISARYFKIVKGKRRFDAGSKELELVLALSFEAYEDAEKLAAGEDEPKPLLVRL